MKVQLTQPELDHLLPKQPGVAAHCRRVAALGSEIAGRLSITGRPFVWLEQSALLHHLARPRLARLPEGLRATLLAFHGIPARERVKNTRQCGGALLVSNLLDEQLELLPLIPQSVAEIFAGLRDIEGLIGAPVMAAASRALETPYRNLAAHFSGELPVSFALTHDVFLALSGILECDVPFLSKLAGHDPVMAGSLVATANSASFARRGRVRSLPQAIAYIGTEHARKVMLALALKPLFASGRLAVIWRHSVELAQCCEALAAATGIMPPEEALLLGLVHDIGRIAIQKAPGQASRAYARFLEKGCPPVYTERLLFDCHHGEIGASVLSKWRFPEAMVQAVMFHHRPADCESIGASLLHMAEFWLDPDEDLPSARHLHAASARTGITLEMLGRVGKGDQALTALLGAKVA